MLTIAGCIQFALALVGSTAVAGENGADGLELGDFSVQIDIDIEKTWESLGIAGEPSETMQSPLAVTMNLQPEYEINDTTLLYLDYEIESEDSYHGWVKEFFLESELQSWTYRLGRQTLPFSDSQGEFIGDSFYEIAETSKTSLLATYFLEDGPAITGYLFESQVDTRDNAHQLDGGAGLSYGEFDRGFFVGIGYLTDLSEILEPLVEIEPGALRERSAGLSGQVYLTSDQWRIMLEHVQAMDGLDSAEAGSVHPRATSLEAIFFSQEHWLIGARVQYSDQIEFLPEWEVGITGRYWVDEKLSIGVEFSHGEFREGLLDEDDNILKDINVVWLELTLEF